MRPAVKVGLVAAGYLGAFLVASAAVAVRLAATSGPEAQASSGMYAFGDAVLFVGVSRGPRVALLAAAAVELAVVMFATFSWFVPLYFPTN